MLHGLYIEAGRVLQLQKLNFAPDNAVLDFQPSSNAYGAKMGFQIGFQVCNVKVKQL